MNRDTNGSIYGIDTRVLEKLYKGFYLRAQYSEGRYMGTIEKHGSIVVKLEGTAIDAVMETIKDIVDSDFFVD